MTISLDMRKHEVAVTTVHLQSMLLYIFVITVQEEAHRAPGMRQPSAIEASDSAGSHY